MDECEFYSRPLASQSICEAGTRRAYAIRGLCKRRETGLTETIKGEVVLSVQKSDLEKDDESSLIEFISHLLRHI